MLLQPAHDGLHNASIVLLPAWPCEWSVKFKLHAPQSTVVEVDYDGSREQAHLEVVPPERREAVSFARCVADDLPH
jgi:hypothetical protein